jgi:AAA family ATP:ADP antiporter
MSLLKGLNRIRKSFPAVSFDAIRVSSLIDQESQIHHQWSMTLASMESDSSSNGAEDDEIVHLLKKTLREKMDECVERTFRLLALIYPPDDVYSTYFSFVARPALRGSAVEFLDNLLEPALRASVVPMVEDDMNRAGSDSDDAGLAWSEAMNLLAASGDRWLTAIAQELSQKSNFRNVSPRIA